MFVLYGHIRRLFIGEDSKPFIKKTGQLSTLQSHNANNMNIIASSEERFLLFSVFFSLHKNFHLLTFITCYYCATLKYSTNCQGLLQLKSYLVSH